MFVAAGCLLVVPELFPWYDPLFGAANVNCGYFVLGIAMGAWSSERVARLPALILLATSCLLIAIAANEAGSALLTALTVVTLCGAISGLDSAANGANSFLSSALRYLGFASLAIYMLHTVFSAGVREVLISMGILNLPLHLFAGNVAGLLLPILVLSLVQKKNLQRILGL